MGRAALASGDGGRAPGAPLTGAAGGGGGAGAGGAAAEGRAAATAVAEEGIWALEAPEV
jgi:hypothetical protein